MEARVERSMEKSMDHSDRISPGVLDIQDAEEDNRRQEQEETPNLRRQAVWLTMNILSKPREKASRLQGQERGLDE